MAWKSIAVVGAGEADGETLKAAEEVGRLVAARGCAVITGGHNGVMEAACRGAKAANGLTIGILSGLDHEVANCHVDIPIPTGMGQARNAIVVSSATEAVIAVGGEFGTLSEIGLALKLGKRVIGLQTWELSKLGERSDAIAIAESPEEAVRLALGE